MEPGRAGNTDNFLHFQEYSIILFSTIPTVHRIIFVIQKFISDLKNANFINHYVNMEIHNTNSKQGNHIHLSSSYGEAGVTKRGISISTKCVVEIEWNFAVGCVFPSKHFEIKMTSNGTFWACIIDSFKKSLKMFWSAIIHVTDNLVICSL